MYAFYLHPDAWGSGAAEPLMMACTEFLRAAGFHEAVLWVLRDNPRAHRFYEKTGWSLTGREGMFDGPQVMGPMPGRLPEVEYGVRLT